MLIGIDREGDPTGRLGGLSLANRELHCMCGAPLAPFSGRGLVTETADLGLLLGKQRAAICIRRVGLRVWLHRSLGFPIADTPGNGDRGNYHCSELRAMTLPYAGQRGTILYNVRYSPILYQRLESAEDLDPIQGPLKLKREKTVMDLQLIHRKAGAGHYLPILLLSSG